MDRPPDAFIDRDRARKSVLAIVIVIATLAAYAAITRAGFISLDDPGYFAENDLVRRGLTTEGFWWALRAGEMSNWHPLTWLSYMLDAQVLGVSAVPIHVENVVLHVVNALLLFALMDRLTGRMWQSALVAALFALHPAHVESVAWISERKDVLSTLFWLLATMSYVKYATRPTLARYAVTALLLALGLLTKPMLVTVPFTFLLLDVWPLRRVAIGVGGKLVSPSPGGPRLALVLIEKAPLLVLTAAASVATVWAQRQAGAVASIENLPFAGRFTNAVVSYARYVGILIWPTRLCAIYPHPGTWPASTIAVAAVVVVLVSAAAARWARPAPHLAFGWLFFLGTLVPVIGIVQVGQQAMADRYTYVPFIGLFVAIVWGAADLAKRVTAPKALVATLALVWLAALGGMTAHQVQYWTDSLTLFEHALRVTDRNVVVHDRLGAALNHLGRHQEAREHFRAVLAIRPRDAGAHLGLGMAAHDMGHLDEAVTEFRKALQIRPDFAEAHGNLALALRMQGRIDEAIGEFAAAARLSPGHADSQANLGNALLSRGRALEAVGAFERARSLRPRDPVLEYRLGNAFFASGDLPAAIGQYQSALRLNEAHAPTHHLLGIALARAGRSDEAIAQMRRAVELDPGLVYAHANLAAVLGTSGRRGEALVELRSAAAAARAAGRLDLARSLDDELQRQLQQEPGAP
jgi:protein O-mannosyl-transferase